MADKPKITTNSVRNMQEAAEKIRALSPKADRILVGPVLIYGDDVGMVVVSGPPGNVDFINFGKYSPDYTDEPFASACAQVLILRRGDEVTIEEAQQSRTEFIAIAAGLFRGELTTYHSDEALAEAFVEMFPSAKSRKILEDVRNERL